MCLLLIGIRRMMIANERDGFGIPTGRTTLLRLFERYKLRLRPIFLPLGRPASEANDTINQVPSTSVRFAVGS